MDEMILIESETLRQRLCTNKNTDLLDRVGQLVELPGTAWATIENIADFYMVGIEAIKSIVKRHRKELREDGYKVLSRKEFEKVQAEPFEISNRGITIFPRRAVLIIGMLLRHSQVAQLLRSYLLNIEQSQANYGDSLMKMANQLAQHSLQISKNVEELGELAQMSINQSRIICAVVADVYRNKDKIQQVQNDVNQCRSEVDFLHERVATIERKMTNVALEECI